MFFYSKVVCIIMEYLDVLYEHYIVSISNWPVTHSYAPPSIPIIRNEKVYHNIVIETSALWKPTRLGPFCTHDADKGRPILRQKGTMKLGNHGNAFRITGNRWTPHTKTSNAELCSSLMLTWTSCLRNGRVAGNLSVHCPDARHSNALD